jgi:hypothetical protein
MPLRMTSKVAYRPISNPALGRVPKASFDKGHEKKRHLSHFSQATQCLAKQIKATFEFA